MEAVIVENESTLYAWALLGVLPLMVVWEAVSVRRPLVSSLRLRWSNVVVLYALSLGAVIWLIPLRCVDLARLTQVNGWGLLGDATLPLWASLPLVLIALDLCRFGLHAAGHHVAVLWRIHRLHHTDPDMDVMTSFRFHPVEFLLGIGLNMLVILLLGLPASSVIVYEVLSLAVNVFNHGNVRIPRGLDAALRVLLVTPDMHRVHHSSEAGEYNANLGGLLSVWDRLFGTYIAHPRECPENMAIGLRGFSDRRHQWLHWMLANPFLREPNVTTPAGTADEVTNAGLAPSSRPGPGSG